MAKAVAVDDVKDLEFLSSAIKATEARVKHLTMQLETARIPSQPGSRVAPAEVESFLANLMALVATWEDAAQRSRKVLRNFRAIEALRLREDLLLAL